MMMCAVVILYSRPLLFHVNRVSMNVLLGHHVVKVLEDDLITMVVVSALTMRQQVTICQVWVLVNSVYL